MTIARGVLNNHPIIEDDAAVGVAITDLYGNGQPDIMASNAAIIARGGLALTHTGDPTVNDDLIYYDVGARWINTSTSGIFVCVDNSSTGASWKETIQGDGSIVAITQITQSGYDDLSSPVSTTLYVVVG